MSASVSFRAWSSTVRLVIDDERAAPAAAAVLRDLLAEVDAVASRFRADSALSRANALAGRPVAVPRELARLVQIALATAAATDGAVDPTVGGDLVALGYDRDIAEVRGHDRPASGRRPVARRTWRDIGLDTDVGLLTVPVGAALDLGATAKAATADRAADLLHHRFGGPVLVELGGDIATAGGTPGTGGWSVAVAEREGDPAAQHVVLGSGGLATSSTGVRTWTQAGRPVHHVLDPRTGTPVRGPWRTVTVAAPTALLANTASTAALVLGHGAVAWLTRRGLAARLVAHGGSVRTVGRWPVATVVGRRAA